MVAKKSFSDARRTENRVRRAQGMCTVCATALPKEVLAWGLMWSDKKTGICTECLFRIRSVGFKYFSEDCEEDDEDVSPNVCSLAQSGVAQI